jgi:aspartyl-tRNA(Asn)/glutamyl-tRNA(Gln) amidotransferase subunit A
MSTIDVGSLTIAQAGAAFRSGQFSPLALTETYLERIGRFDPTLNCFITVTAEQALAAARRATEEFKVGLDRGPLSGIPVAYKDLMATAGIRTTSGARIHSDRIPERDATVVRHLSEAGAVSLGKLNMLEFAYGVVHRDFGPTRNPWNLQYSTGGSSTGSGAAVAAGLCLGSLGTDTGGSIRLPAAWCGVVGLKPTYGLVSRGGVDPLSWSLDHVGPLTRTVEDAALLLEAIAVHDPADPGSTAQRRFDASDLDQVDPTQLRVGVPRDVETVVDSQARQVFAEALELLELLGLAVEVVTIPDLEELLSVQYVILFAEASAYHQPWLRTRPHEYSPLLRDRLEAGAAIPAIHYINAQRVRRALIEDFAALHEQVDLLVLPAAPTAPMGIDATEFFVDGEPVDPLRTLVRILGPFNVTGAPVVSVPCGWAPNGLPYGLQIAGRPFEDHVVLAAARAFETARGESLHVPAAFSEAAAEP